MNYEKRNCEACGEEFTPKGKNQYGVQKFCSKGCKDKFHNKYEKRKKSSVENYNTAPNTTNEIYNAASKKTKSSLKQEVAEVQQFLYNVKNGNKVITQFKELAEKAINTMQIMKLNTYSASVKAVCIEIMENLHLFLQNQLKIEKDTGVIVVQAE